MDALRRDDPFALQRSAELARADGRFAAHPLLILLHVIPGGFFLLLAPLQFSTWIRTRHFRVHRWSGRVLLPAGLVVVGVVLDAALTPAGVRPPDIFVLSVWTGWVITIGVAELWIRHTRPRRALPGG